MTYSIFTKDIKPFYTELEENETTGTAVTYSQLLDVVPI